jgi:hypothetical protein
MARRPGKQHLNEKMSKSTKKKLSKENPLFVGDVRPSQPRVTYCLATARLVVYVCSRAPVIQWGHWSICGVSAACSESHCGCTLRYHSHCGGQTRRHAGLRLLAQRCSVYWGCKALLISLKTRTGASGGDARLTGICLQVRTNVRGVLPYHKISLAKCREANRTKE